MGDVKISKTRLKAAQTRLRMIRAAYELLCRDGYRATTMQAIADRAGVAVQTMYFTFGRKDDVLQAVHEWTVLGDDPVPPEQQAWFLEVEASSSAVEALAPLARGCAMLNARVAPMLPVFAAVAGEPARETWDQTERLRMAGMRRLARILGKKTPLTVPDDRAAELLFVLTGPEMYREFVLRLGWSDAEWAEWLVRSLAREILPAAG